MSSNCGTGHLPGGYNSQKARGFCLFTADNPDILLASRSECRGPLERAQRQQERPPPPPLAHLERVQQLNCVTKSMLPLLLDLEPLFVQRTTIPTILNEGRPSTHQLRSAHVNKRLETFPLFLSSLPLCCAGKSQGDAQAIPVPAAGRQWPRALVALLLPPTFGRKRV